jgi:cobalamin biosynthesis protein CobD/CbiB
MNKQDGVVAEPDTTETSTVERLPGAVSAPGRTLLPGPLAALVSTATGITSLGVRVSTKVTGFWIAGARETTLTSLELARAAVEAVLTAAGRDVSQRRNGGVGQAEAESILETSVCALAPRFWLLTNVLG